VKPFRIGGFPPKHSKGLQYFPGAGFGANERRTRTLMMTGAA
jgi:hypothetical protein